MTHPTNVLKDLPTLPTSQVAELFLLVATLTQTQFSALEITDLIIALMIPNSICCDYTLFMQEAQGSNSRPHTYKVNAFAIDLSLEPQRICFILRGKNLLACPIYSVAQDGVMECVYFIHNKVKHLKGFKVNHDKSM